MVECDRRPVRSSETVRPVPRPRVLRTSVQADELIAGDVVRSYNTLARAERDFRTLGGVELELRPIHHALEERVHAHVFLCLLTYYLEWHLRELSGACVQISRRRCPPRGAAPPAGRLATPRRPVGGLAREDEGVAVREPGSASSPIRCAAMPSRQRRRPSAPSLTGMTIEVMRAAPSSPMTLSRATRRRLPSGNRARRNDKRDTMGK